MFALDTLGGVPAHPLIVHVPVVMIPLAFVLAALAFVPRFRTLALWGAAGSGLIGVLGAALANGSGEALQNAVERTDLLRAHTQAGEAVAAFGAVFLVAVVGTLAVHLAHNDSLPFADRLSFFKKVPAAAIAGLVAASVALGAVASWKTYDAGHSGAKSAWRNIDVTKIQEHEGHGDDD